MITRRPLRDDVRQEVLSRLLSGQLPPGARLKEIALAKELGVSRTPLREALHELERDGFLHSIPGRGFTVTEFTSREVEEVFPLMWTLESQALRGSGALPDPLILELERINERIVTERTRPQICLDLDRLWHQRLLSEVSNRRLSSWLDSLRDTIRRYDAHFTRQPTQFDNMAEHHRAVAQALRSGNVGQACYVLEEHWRGGMVGLLRVLGTESLRTGTDD
jgi:DNA-binding GntR family transcriptional regulator